MATKGLGEHLFAKRKGKDVTKRTVALSKTTTKTEEGKAVLTVKKTKKASVAERIGLGKFFPTPEDTLWAVGVEVIEPNWQLILAEALHRITEFGGEYVVRMGAIRSDDGVVISQQCHALKGHTSEEYFLPLRWNDSLRMTNEVIDLLDALNVFMKEREEQRLASELRQKAISSLAPWQREALKL